MPLRMPAEWEPHDATWLGWPHNASDWPGKIGTIPWVYGEIVRKIAGGETVRILLESVAQEAQARRMLDYCGLEWSDACLDFHKHKRSIRTASVTQVRQPIYKTSVERWRSYEKHLGPLLDALGDLAPGRG